MHLTLTDRLTCPRCGPAAGLIVMMDEVADRRVVTGTLACPACGTRYPITGRVADLRASDAHAEPPGAGVRGRAGGGAGANDAVRVAGLLGLGEGAGFVVVDGPSALAVGAGVGELASAYEPVVVIDPAEAEAAGDAPVSALLTDRALPLADSLMRAAAYVGGAPNGDRLRELVRVVRPTGRVVVDGATAAELDEASRVLVELGAEVRARDGGGLVAVVM